MRPPGVIFVLPLGPYGAPSFASWPQTRDSMPGPSPRQRSFRRSHHVWLSPRTWRRRLVFWAGALAIGVVSVLFALACDLAQDAFVGAMQWSPAIALGATPVAMALSAWLARQWFPGSQGSDIPQAFAARDRTLPALRHTLLSRRVAVGKILLCTLGLLGGASIGREGPSVQVGAAIMVFAGRIGGVGRELGLILAGSAAGIAAAFNAPLAGIVFAIEEMGRSFEQRISTLVVIAVIFAGIASESLSGNVSYFGTTTEVVSFPEGWPVVVVLGVAGGALGGLFSRAVILVMRRIPKMFSGALGRRPILFAAGCGLAAALIGLASHGATFGTGYDQARQALVGNLDHAWRFFGLKLLATILAGICGMPGGVFSPSISVGAGLGAAFSPFFPGTASGAAALIGMAAYFTGVVQAPITAFVIVVEMSDSHATVIPLMAAAMIAYGVSRLVCTEPLDHALAKNFRAVAKA